MSPAVAIKCAALCQQLLVEIFSQYLIVYSSGVKQDSSWRPFPSPIVTLGKLYHTTHISYKEM